MATRHLKLNEKRRRRFCDWACYRAQDEPNFSTVTRGGYKVAAWGGKQVKEHRWVMEKTLGRPLLEHENVHHINGQRADNRIENLELWSSSQPPGQRVEDKLAWAAELLCIYDPESLSRRWRSALQFSAAYRAETDVVTALPGKWTKDGGGYLVKNIAGRTVRQHRWVMTRVVGRVLLPSETVHHKNGDRADNRIENLELWSSSHPPGQRVDDKVEWAHELLMTYAPLVLRPAFRAQFRLAS